MNDKDVSIILEALDDKLAVFIENVETVVDTRVRSIVRRELAPIKSDVAVIKAVTTETNKSLNKLGNRIQHLEDQTV